jgi:hypothetical protein
MKIQRPALLHLPLKGWAVLLPTLLILALALVLTETSNAAPAAAPQSRTLVGALLFEPQQPTCQSCHPAEYADWQGTTHAKAALDPAFRKELSVSHNQAECLKCHTTGFDAASGKFLAEGVTCEACHGAYKEGHPAKETMQLPMASQTCRTCHLGTFEEWEKSSHRDRGIECFDCHMAHTQGLRTGSEQKLCAACHADRQTEVAHATHGVNGVQCASCHMAPATTPNARVATASPSVAIPARSHSFTVASDTCVKCHSDTIHASNKLPQLRTTVAQLDTQQLQAKADQAPILEKQVNDLQARLVGLRNVAVAGMGLAFSLGGVLGLLTGVVGMSLWRRRA